VDILETHYRSRHTERLILRELTHRVSNELAAVTALVAAARTRPGNAQETLLRVQGALEAFASVQRLLYVPDTITCVDGCAYVRQLCGALTRAKLEEKGIELEFVEKPFRIDSDQCWRLGMILYELVTNASKHAFGGDSGWIRVELFEHTTHLECRIEDSGSCISPHVSRGAGLAVVHELTEEMGGALQQTFGLKGSVSTIILPRAPKGAQVAQHQEQRLECRGACSNSPEVGDSRN
jgi:two-component sensor histidine kinase